MNAPPTSQTVVEPNPDSAQLIVWLTTLNPGLARSAGEYNVQRDSTATRVRPISPTAGLGSGSVTSAAITPVKIAKYHQACCASPGGGGVAASARVSATGTATR